MTVIRPLFVTALLAGGLCLAPAAAAQAEPVLQGRVVDARSGLPVERALVSAGARRTGTDDRGWFRLCNVAAGQAEVRIAANRYLPATASVAVPPDGTAEVELALQADTVPPRSILLDRPRTLAPSSLQQPIYILDGERVFVSTSGCESPPPGVRAVDELPRDAIESIEILRGREAVERYGPEAERGVVLITTGSPRRR